MGAALGLELVMRLAIFKKRATALFQRDEGSQGFKAKRGKIIAGMTEGTFGQVAAQFEEMHPDLRTALFEEALSNAVGFRNNLGHRFLVHHLWDLTSERGLDLMATECMLYLDHFQRLEDHIRGLADIDWEGLKRPNHDNSRHPLSEWLDEAQNDWTQG